MQYSGPIVFRRRLRVGERAMMIAGEHSGKVGTVAAPSDATGTVACPVKPLHLRLDSVVDTSAESRDACVRAWPHEVRRLARSSVEVRFEADGAAPVAGEGAPSSGRRAWSVAERDDDDDPGAPPPVPSQDASATTTRPEPTLYEAAVRWHPRLAGRVWEVPLEHDAPGVTTPEHGTRIRFECPLVTRGAWVVCQATLVGRTAAALADEITLTRLLPAPWNVATKHWRITDDKNAALSGAASGISRGVPGGGGGHSGGVPGAAGGDGDGAGGGALEQRPDGTVRVATQTPAGKFVDVCATHLVEGRERHQFAFDITSCRTDRAYGIKVGVASGDGASQWVLRLSDARMCDASGRPVSEPLLEKDYLPSRCMGIRVEIRVNLALRTLHFHISAGGQLDGGRISGFWEAPAVALPDAVRPCVHMYYQGDAVRLCGHARLPNAGAAPGRAASPLRFSARGRASPPPQTTYSIVPVPLMAGARPGTVCSWEGALAPYQTRPPQQETLSEPSSAREPRTPGRGDRDGHQHSIRGTAMDAPGSARAASGAASPGAYSVTQGRRPSPRSARGPRRDAFAASPARGKFGTKRATSPVGSRAGASVGPHAAPGREGGGSSNKENAPTDARNGGPGGRRRATGGEPDAESARTAAQWCRVMTVEDTEVA